MTVGGLESARRVVGNLELSSLVVEVEDSLLLVALGVGKSGSVRRLDSSLVLVLKDFILDLDTVLARDTGHVFVFLEVRLDVCLQELLGVHLTQVLAISRLGGHHGCCLGASVANR